MTAEEIVKIYDQALNTATIIRGDEIAILNLAQEIVSLKKEIEGMKKEIIYRSS